MTSCPRCRINIIQEDAATYAISRRDNETHICPYCGEEEAFFDLKIALLKREEMKWMNPDNKEFKRTM